MAHSVLRSARWLALLPPGRRSVPTGEKEIFRVVYAGPAPHRLRETISCGGRDFARLASDAARSAYDMSHAAPRKERDTAAPAHVQTRDRDDRGVRGERHRRLEPGPAQPGGERLEFTPAAGPGEASPPARITTVWANIDADGGDTEPGLWGAMVLNDSDAPIRYAHLTVRHRRDGWVSKEGFHKIAPHTRFKWSAVKVYAHASGGFGPSPVSRPTHGRLPRVHLAWRNFPFLHWSLLSRIRPGASGW